MCGLIALATTTGARPLPHEREELDRLRDSLAHRGPDAGETWIDSDGRVALMHRRLKVIDLDGGRQPMACPRQRYHLAYNGEIYNFRELRAELEADGVEFRTESDTEVLLAAYAAWGADCVHRLNGIFAFVVWDARSRRMFLARDHFGVKPLYYGAWGGVVYVASEARAIVADPRVPRHIDAEALDLYFHHSYVPAPWAIWHGMHKLKAAHRLTLDLDGTWRGFPDQEPYWKVPFGQEAGTPASEEELLEELDATLRSAVRRQTVSDVPLGAFLSGGVDSSLVVAYLAEYSSRPVQTFSVGYDEREFDERPYARRVAERFGTDHHELRMGAESMNIIPHLAEAYDEPFSDTAAAPTAAVSRLAREHVTVVLSGDGGDETHAGYPRYLRMRQLRWLDAIPGGVRRASFGRLAAVAPSWKRRGMFELASRGIEDRYDALTTKVPWAHRQEAYTAEFRAKLQACAACNAGDGMTDWRRDLLARLPSGTALVDRFQYLDLVSYLPDQLMVKVDRASMLVSLEARVPLLDTDAVAFAARIPVGWRVRDGRPKYLLRKLLARIMGRDFADRKKHGFRVPKENWLREVPRGRLEASLFPDGIEAWLDRRGLCELLFATPRGLELAWPFLMFAAWYRRYGGSPSS
jgi:asparagine synthase (glutamine-hydrolysing)